MLSHPTLHIAEDGDVRKYQLRRLDSALAELESLNLKGVTFVPDPLQRRLLAIGVAHPAGASVSEVIGLVFHAQERFLSPTSRSGRRSAA